MLPKRDRIKFLFIILLVPGMFLTGKLFRLQVMENRDWARRAVSQRARSLSNHRVRGTIRDRFGRPLTERESKPVVIVFPWLLNNDGHKLLNIINSERTEGTVAVEGDKEELYIIKEPGERLLKFIREDSPPGLSLVYLPVRYGSEPLATHLIGYHQDYRGVAGLEYTYEKHLMTTEGGRLSLLVDGLSNPLTGPDGLSRWSVTGTRPKELVLTIDLLIQRLVETTLDREKVKKGAAVIVEVDSGRILAMASRPLYDPHHPGRSLLAPDSPFINRSVTAYHPGSVFKIIVAAAALEQGLAHPETTFYDYGYLDLGKNRFKCSKFSEGGHGVITFTQALAYSCNPVLIKVGLKTGADAILDMAEKTGLGKKLQLGLREEQSGELPQISGLSVGDLANLVMGQKGVFITPVQVAGLIQAVANDGRYIRPYVVEGLKDSEGRWFQRNEPASPVQVISGYTARNLQNMLEAAVLYGTGKAAQTARGSAGKTGTAETGRFASNGQQLYHCWFAGYTPAVSGTKDSPRLAGVIFLEDHPAGGGRAAELFAKIMNKALDLYLAQR